MTLLLLLLLVSRQMGDFRKSSLEKYTAPRACLYASICRRFRTDHATGYWSAQGRAQTLLQMMWTY